MQAYHERPDSKCIITVYDLRELTTADRSQRVLESWQVGANIEQLIQDHFAAIVWAGDALERAV